MMSELSEAMERAQKRLDAMSQEQREKLYHIVLREELQRGRDKDTTNDR
jgi:hypothetical protein